MITSKVDALIVCAYPSDVHELIGLMKKAAYRPGPAAITIAPILPDFYDRAGSFAKGIFAPSQWEADERIPFPGKGLLLPVVLIGITIAIISHRLVVDHIRSFFSERSAGSTGSFRECVF